MTPIQAARKHCDCILPNDLCLGITINDSYSLVRFRPENSPCLLAGKDCQRCKHFEAAILPMESREEWAKDSRASESLRKDFREAAHAYRIQSGALSQYDRLCSRCNTRELQPRQRFCYVCTRELELESNRKYAAKRRESLKNQKVES